MNDNMGISGELDAVPSRWRPHDVTKSWRLPFGKGRLLYTKDTGSSLRMANEQFQTHLSAVHYGEHGQVKEVRDIGSGTVTNVGVLALANDFAWANPSGVAFNIIGQSNFHAVGTGTNAAAITDIQCQTLAAPTTATAVTGVQSLVAGLVGGDAASVQIYQTVATVNFTSTLAITEWGLFNNATLSATTGSPFTAGTANTGTVTATPLTASTTTVAGEQQFIFQDNTAATKFWGLVTSNTTSVVTVPAWYTTAAGAISTVNPVNADAYTIQPVCFDHQVFAALNVINGDSIQFTFKLQIVSGG